MSFSIYAQDYIVHFNRVSISYYSAEKMQFMGAHPHVSLLHSGYNEVEKGTL